MSISFEGIGHQSVTFPAGVCTVGYACKMGSDGRVANCANNNQILGVVEQVDKGWAGVQIHGFVTLPYTGTAPTAGFASLSANGSGGVKVDSTNGRTYLVVNVNTAAAIVTFEL